MTTRLAPSPAAPHIAAREEATRFFFALYQGTGLQKGEWYELRWLDCRTSPATFGGRSYVRSITDLVDKALALRDRWDVFFGVGLRRCPQTHDMHHCGCVTKGLDHVSRVPGSWVDVDVQSRDEPTKRYSTLFDAQEAIHEVGEATGVPATILVCSGAGLHAYWPLAEGPTDAITDAVDINQRLAATLGVDNCGDAPRVLRVPGTINHKHGVALPVYLIEPRAPETSWTA